MKYKLIQKVNPNRRDDPPQWYATPITGESEGADATTRAATENTTTAPIELTAGLVHLTEYAISKLSKGEPVPLGEMGDNPACVSCPKRRSVMPSSTSSPSRTPACWPTVSTMPHWRHTARRRACPRARAKKKKADKPKPRCDDTPHVSNG